MSLSRFSGLLKLFEFLVPMIENTELKEYVFGFEELDSSSTERGKVFTFDPVIEKNCNALK